MTGTDFQYSTQNRSFPSNLNTNTTCEAILFMRAQSLSPLTSDQFSSFPILAASALHGKGLNVWAGNKVMLSQCDEQEF